MANGHGHELAAVIVSPTGRLLVQCLVIGAAAGVLYARIGSVESQVARVDERVSKQQTTTQEQGRQLDRIDGRLNDVVLATMDRQSQTIRDLEQRVRAMEMQAAQR